MHWGIRCVLEFECNENDSRVSPFLFYARFQFVGSITVVVSGFGFSLAFCVVLHIDGNNNTINFCFGSDYSAILLQWIDRSQYILEFYGICRGTISRILSISEWSKLNEFFSILKRFFHCQTESSRKKIDCLKRTMPNVLRSWTQLTESTVRSSSEWFDFSMFF